MLSVRWLIATAFLYSALSGPAASQVFSSNSPDDKLQQADSLQEKGSLAAARAIYESVLKTLPPDPPSGPLGHALNGLSHLAFSEGKYSEAIQLAHRADEVYRELGKADGRAYALNNLGNAEGELGQYPEAQSHFEQALSFSRAAADFETLVRTLNNLGNVYYYPGQYREAYGAYEEALRILEQHPVEKWTAYWRQITNFNEATLYQRLGRYEQALAIYQHIKESSTGLDASDRAHLDTNLGALYRRLGDPYKALDSYRAALKLYTQGHDSAGEITTVKNIGIVYALDRGNLRLAQEFFDRTLALALQTHNHREVTQAHLYRGEALFRRDQLEASRNEFRSAWDDANRLGMPEEQWKALYGMARVEELAGRPGDAEQEYRQAVSIIESTRIQLQLSALRTDFMADKRDAYDGLISLLLKKGDIQQAFQFIERSRARTFQDRIASAAPQAPPPVVPTIREIQSYLDPATVLWEFWVTGNQIALIWCTRDQYGADRTVLSDPVAEHLFTFLRGLPDTLRSDWKQQSATLQYLLPSGLRVPQSAKHILIVPDGWLGTVPFDLVSSTAVGGQFLIERADITYLPTAALLRRNLVDKHGLRFPWQSELTAFGDPLSNAAGQGGGLSSGLEAVPYSAEEIQSIAKMTRGRSTLFLGSRDLKSEFLTLRADEGPILHIGTHATADADVPENSRILFTPARSGVAPEYLFLREIYDLDLRNVNLSTLSACDTERGKLLRGEGIQAFSRALLAAGSHATVTTLWRVADQPTTEFMKQFYYFALQRRQTKAEALRSAKLRLLHSGTALDNPAHWAGFVLNGDGLGTLPTFVSWEMMFLVASVLVILLLVSLRLLWIRRRVNRIHRSHLVVTK